MKWLTAILSFFTGNGGAKVADVADKAFYTQQEKAADTIEEEKISAAMVANTSIDFINRSIRPVVTYYYLGGFVGLWPLPKPEQIDPVNFQIFMIIITFWFGGRIILKDLPVLIAAILKMKRG